MPADLFPWPHGARAALALTYDDALPGHRARVADDLRAADIAATFFTPIGPDLLGNAAAWTRVAGLGHELGNHTCFHPCRRGPGRDWVRDFALDDYTPGRWQREVDLASGVLRLLDGRARRSFGNTCHEEAIGPPGAEIDLRPLIRERFAAGRGPHREPGFVADPRACDPGGIGTIGGDGRTAAQLLANIDAAIAAGGLLIIAMHGVGPRDFPTLHIAEDEHAALIRGIAERRRDLWAAPLAEIGEVITARR